MDIKKLQTLVVDALEDVKAQEIRVFDTTHLTSLFDRVAIASGTSNRQTKALAASVRDKVKSKGGHVVSMEGEDTGEWVLVDLGDMIVHIMQPAIRAYYRLEEIWGDKEVKMGAAKRTGTSATAKRVAAETGDAPMTKMRRTKAQAEAVEASQALDDDGDAQKKPARKPRATPAAGTTTRVTGTRGAGTTRSTATSRGAAGAGTTGTARATRTTRAAEPAATPRATRTAASGAKAAAPKATSTRATAARSTTAKAGGKSAASKTPVGKTVRVASAKSTSAKKPAAKRTAKA